MQIRIFLAEQVMELLGSDGACIRRYVVSTAARGAGEMRGSYCTPRGRHVIRACIGKYLPAGSVFKARRPTGEIWSQQLHDDAFGRDWILSRILWLSGTEPQINRLGDVDTMRRYIYIHGTPDCETMGVPMSHGCIRMRNADVIELFELVGPGCPVEILE